jgi:PAS domain-containing protein
MTELEQILHRYKLILTSAGEGIYGLDLEGNGTFVNPAAIATPGLVTYGNWKMLLKERLFYHQSKSHSFLNYMNHIVNQAQTCHCL